MLINKVSEVLLKMNHKEKACSVLSYLFVGIIWFFVDKEMRNSAFVRFHAGQGIVFLLTGLLVGVINAILIVIPIIGELIVKLISLIVVLLLVQGVWNVLTESKKELFVIGKFAQKLKL